MDWFRGSRVDAWRWSLVLVMVASGCPADGEDSDGDRAADSGDTSASTVPTAGDESESSAGAELPWSDVSCGDAVCGRAEFCLHAPAYCTGPCENDDQVPVTPPPACTPFPEGCDGNAPSPCLDEMFCSPAGGQFDEGSLQCSPEVDDCYCGS